VFDVNVFEAPQQGLRATVERLKVGVFDAIFAAHLFDDELGIQAYRETADAALRRALEPDTQRGPLGDVVGGGTEVAPDLIDHGAVGANEYGSAGRRAGVSARAAIGKKRRICRECVKERGHRFECVRRWYNPAMRHVLLRGFAALALLSLTLIPNAAWAASTFYGLTVHVSTNNIKVKDPRTGQTLSFEILPKFDQVFSGDGKATYQMKDVHNGQYVGIIYDQKALGMRHADKIYIMNNANQRISAQ
jgi:hypothetical protein